MVARYDFSLKWVCDLLICFFVRAEAAFLVAIGDGLYFDVTLLFVVDVGVVSSVISLFVVQLQWK